MAEGNTTMYGEKAAGRQEHHNHTQAMSQQHWQDYWLHLCYTKEYSSHAKKKKKKKKKKGFRGMRQQSCPGGSLLKLTASYIVHCHL